MKTFLKTGVLLVSLGALASSPDPSFYQYWFDKDETSRPGNTHVYDAQSNPLTIDASGLSEGGHAVNYRMADKNKRWGSVMTRYFVVPSAIPNDPKEATEPELMQYWFDNDESSRTKNTQTYNPQSTSFDVDAATLTPGGHALKYRMANKFGQWGSVMTRYFNIPIAPDQSSSKAVAYRVWVNNDIVANGSVPSTSDFTITATIPENPTLGSVKSREFAYRAGERTVSMAASGTFSCAFQMLSESNEWGMPLYSEYEHSATVKLPIDSIAVPCDYTFAKTDNNGFKAYRFTCSDTQSLYFKASQDCNMDLYRVDSSADSKLSLLNTFSLKKGQTSRYDGSGLIELPLVAILYDTPKNSENPADDIFLRIMYEDSRLPKPIITFDNDTWEVTITCADKRAEILYTLNGDQPNRDSENTFKYSGPFRIEKFTRIKAMAVYGDLADSMVEDLLVNDQSMRIPRPELVYHGGKGLNEFILTNSLDGVTTYYVIGDGDIHDETQRKTFDGTPFIIEDGALLKAYSTKDQLADSEMLSMTVRHNDYVTMTPVVSGYRSEGEDQADVSAIRHFIQISVPEGKAKYRVLTGKKEYQYGEEMVEAQWTECGEEWIELPGGALAGNQTVQIFAETDDKVRSAVMSHYTDWVKALKPRIFYDNYRLKLTSDMPDGVIMYIAGGYDPETALEYKAAELPDGIDLSDISSVSAWVQAEGYTASDWVTVNRDEYNLFAPSIEYQDDGYLHITHDMEDVSFHLDIQPGNQKMDTVAANHLRFVPEYNTTVEAYAIKRGYNNSEKSVKYPLPKPEIVVDGFNVEIRSDIGTVYYTIDGSKPTQESIKYEGAFKSGIATIRAACFEDGEIPSEAEPKDVIGQTAAPRFEFNFSRKVENGERIDTRLMKLHAEAPETAIYYSFNEAPTESTRKLYDPLVNVEGIDVAGATTVYAYAESEGLRRSDVVSRNTSDGYLSQPSILVNEEVVEITHNDPNVEIVPEFTPQQEFEYLHDERNNKVTCKVLYNTTVRAHVERAGYIESDPVVENPIAKPVIRVDEYTVEIDHTDGEVYYTVDGSMPTKESAHYEDRPFETSACTVRAVAFREGMIPAEADPVKVMDQAAKPEIDIKAGYARLTAATLNSTIYYSLDQGISIGNRKVYNEIEMPNGIDINEVKTLYAYAEAEGYRRSETLDYPISAYTLKSPTLRYEPGTDGTGYVVAAHDDSEVSIRFTDETGKQLDAAPDSPRMIKVDYNSVVYAYAYRKGYVESKAANITHTDPPKFSLDLFTVTISAKDGQTVYYTTDGKTPTTGSTKYDGNPFKVSDNCIVRAVAFADGFIPGEAEPLTIGYHKIAKPQMEKYDGRFVRFSAEDGAKLRYVLGEGVDVLTGNVADPGSPIDLEGLNKITVIAQLPGADDSDPEAYTPKAYANETEAYTSRPGVLKDAFGWCDDLSGFESLSIHGSLNGNSTEDSGDYAFIRSLSALRHLDLSDVTDVTVPDGALAGSHLVSVTFPETLRNAGTGIFGNDNTWLCAVELPSASPAPANLLEGVANTNLLLFARNRTLVDGLLENNGGKVTNFVALDTYNGEVRADEVKLIHGQPFHSPREFKATNISFTRSFTKETQIGNVAGSGWETQVVPFDVQTVTSSDRRTFRPFGYEDVDNGIYPFWLFRADNGSWKNESMILANVPYLLAFPNNPFYSEQFCVNGDVVFSASNVTVDETPLSGDMSYSFGTGNYLTGNYEWIGKKRDVLAINDIQVEYRQHTYLPGGIFISGEKDVAPFEAYVPANGKKAIPVFDQSAIDELIGDFGTLIWSENHSICIRSSIEMKLRIYDTVGQLIRIVDVKAGETVRVDDITPGIYFVGNTKILVKG